MDSGKLCFFLLFLKKLPVWSSIWNMEKWEKKKRWNT